MDSTATTGDLSAVAWLVGLVVVIAVCAYMVAWSAINAVMLYHDTVGAAKRYAHTRRLLSGAGAASVDALTLNDLWGATSIPRETRYASDAHGLKYHPQTFQGAEPKYAVPDDYATTRFTDVAKQCVGDDSLASLSSANDTYTKSEEESALQCMEKSAI